MGIPGRTSTRRMAGSPLPACLANPPPKPRPSSSGRGPVCSPRTELTTSVGSHSGQGRAGCRSFLPGFMMVTGQWTLSPLRRGTEPLRNSPPDVSLLVAQPRLDSGPLWCLCLSCFLLPTPCPPPDPTGQPACPQALLMSPLAQPLSCFLLPARLCRRVASPWMELAGEGQGVRPHRRGTWGQTIAFEQTCSQTGPCTDRGGWMDGGRK